MKNNFVWGHVELTHPVLTFICLAVVPVAVVYTAFIFLSQEWSASENLYTLAHPKQKPSADLKSVLRGAAGSIITEINDIPKHVPDKSKTCSCQQHMVVQQRLLLLFTWNSFRTWGSNGILWEFAQLNRLKRVLIQSPPVCPLVSPRLNSPHLWVYLLIRSLTSHLFSLWVTILSTRLTKKTVIVLNGDTRNI